MSRLRLLSLFTLLVALFVPLWSLLAPQPSAASATGRSVTFTDTGQALGSADTRGIAQGDFDGDGDSDFYAANDGTDRVWLNNGSGVFADSGQTLTTQASFQANAGDVDGDGDLDVVVGHVGGVTLWLNNGSGVFTNSGQSIGGSATNYTDPLLADLDGDTDLDLVLGTDLLNEVWFNQAGVFTNTNQLLGEFPTNDVDAADMDGDGDLDIVTANGSAQQPEVANFLWRNNGSGFFSFGTSFSPLNNQRIALLDVDGDGDIDVYSASFDAVADTLWLNNGSGSLAQSGQSLSPGNNPFVDAVDVDGDGDPDIVLGRDLGAGNEVWLNHSGVLSGTGQLMDTASTWAIGTDDLNGDGNRDLLFGNAGADSVWLADGGPQPTATHTPSPSPSPTPSPTGTPTPPTPAPAGALDWRRDIGASAGDSGVSLDLALDTSGRPHFSHVEQQARTVNYAHWDGVRWYRDVISRTTLSDAETLLALDQQMQPHVVFQETFTGFRYVAYDGAAWSSVATLAGQHIADLILDQNDRPVVAYENENSRLTVARWTGSAWDTTEIQSSFLDDVPAALVRGTGSTLYLAYVEPQFGGEVRLATFDGAAWSVETVAAVGTFDVPQGVDLALDGQNRPVVLYAVGASNNRLVQSTRMGALWTHEEIFLNQSAIRSPGLAYDSQGEAHVMFLLNGRPYYDIAADGWQFSPLPGDEPVGQLSPLALDGNDRAHFGFYDTAYANLNYQYYGPAWDVTVLEASDSARLPAIGHVRYEVGVAFYSLQNQQLRFLERAPGAWIDKPVANLSLPIVSSSVRMRLNGQHRLSLRDSVNDGLLFAAWNGTAWQTEVVDAGGDVGYDNTLFALPGGDVIAYWDRDNLRTKVAARDGAGWVLSANDAGPALNGSSGFQHAVVRNGVVYITYYDGVGEDLRLAEFALDSSTWTDSLLIGGSINVSRYHDLALTAGNRLRVVYHDATNGRLMLATRPLPAAAWSTELIAPGVGSLRGLELDSPSYIYEESLRIAYIDLAAGAVIAAARAAGGQWQFETVRDGENFLTELELAQGERPHLAFAALSANQLEFAVRVPHELQRGMLYSPYDPSDNGDPGNFLANVCAALLDPDLTLGALLNRQPPVIENDYDVLGEMTRVFATSSGGQRYIDLYGQHVDAMVTIGAQDPRLLWDSYQVLQDFMPGLEALVTGRGSTITVTQRMVDNALDVWQRLAAGGNVELANTINSELAAFNDLQDFVGLTFDEWALALGVVPPVHRLYLPAVQLGAGGGPASVAAALAAPGAESAARPDRNPLRAAWPWAIPVLAAAGLLLLQHRYNRRRTVYASTKRLGRNHG